MIYVKPSFDGDEPADVVQYRNDNPVFPHDPTYDQFFDSHKFESYRRLGEHIGEEVWEHLFKASAIQAAEQDQTCGRELISPWLAYWRPTVSEEAPKGDRAGGAQGQPQPAGPAPAPEPDPEAYVDGIRELLDQAVPFCEKLHALQDGLNQEDPQLRMSVCFVIANYMESLAETPKSNRLTRGERRQLCMMLIEHFRREEDVDIKGFLCKILDQYGRQVKEVKKFFRQRDIKEFLKQQHPGPAGGHNGKSHEQNGNNDGDTKATPEKTEKPRTDRDTGLGGH